MDNWPQIALAVVAVGTGFALAYIGFTTPGFHPAEMTGGGILIGYFLPRILEA